MIARVIMLTAASILMLVACGSEPDGGIAALTTLQRGNGGEPGTLDPQLAQDVHAFNVLIDLFEGLVAVDAGGNLISGVAESWDVSEDGLTYTFNLRVDARWSNGDPVVAADFARSLRRAAAPDSVAPYAFLLDPLLNFREVQSGTLTASELGVTADSDRTLTLRLARPTTFWLSILAMPIAFPTPASDDAELISNGAYILKERQIGGPVILTKNDKYWDAPSVRIDEVIYYPIVDPMPEFNRYRAGELDITTSIPSEMVQKVRQQMPHEVRIAPTLALYYLAFDLSEPPLDNTSLRQALSMAIDREKLVTIIGRGEVAAYSIVPPGVTNHVGAKYDWHGLSKADREQMAQGHYAEAGYGDDPPLKIKLTYDVGDIHERVAIAVSSMWRDVLGVDVNIEKKEWKYFLDSRKDRASWQVMRFSWFGDYNDPSTFTDIFRSDSPQNLSLYANSIYDTTLDQASQTVDRQARTLLMTRAEEILIEDYPIAPLYFFVSKHMVKPHISGFEENILDRHPSKYLSILESE